MGFKVGADLDLSVLIESVNGLAKRQDETNKRLREYLHRERINPRDLSGNVQIPAAAAGPLLIDLGSVPPGLAWDVKLVNVFLVDPFTVTAPANPVFCAIFAGSPPGKATLVTGQPVGVTDVIAAALTIPVFERFGSRTRIMTGNEHLYVLVPITAGVAAFVGSTIYATAQVVEVVDRNTALSWL